MAYTAHPMNKENGLPLITIFDGDGIAIDTLNMQDIADLYERENPPEEEDDD